MPSNFGRRVDTSTRTMGRKHLRDDPAWTEQHEETGKNQSGVSNREGRMTRGLMHPEVISMPPGIVWNLASCAHVEHGSTN